MARLGIRLLRGKEVRHQPQAGVPMLARASDAGEAEASEVIAVLAATGNGTAAQTILELAKSKGKAVGSITTTELTHATPAATYAHICNRNAQYAIAAQADALVVAQQTEWILLRAALAEQGLEVITADALTAGIVHLSLLYHGEAMSIGSTVPSI